MLRNRPSHLLTSSNQGLFSVGSYMLKKLNFDVFLFFFGGQVDSTKIEKKVILVAFDKKMISLAKIVITLVKSYQNPRPGSKNYHMPWPFWSTSEKCQILWLFFFFTSDKCEIYWPFYPGCGISKDFSKVMTILANETLIAGPIGPARYLLLAR